jgi:trigger factor
MQVTELKNEGLSREYKVALAASEIDEKVDGKLAEYAKTAVLPGFRPGKVPASLLKKRYGKAVMGEVLEEAVNTSSQQAIMEQGVRPAGQPKIEITAFDEGQDLEYTITLDVMPEIEPVDLSALELEKLVVEVKDEEIDEALTSIASRYKTTAAIDTARPAESGDVVLIDFLGKVDGEAFDGGAAEDYELELGSGSFIPGFEDQLIGASAGDETDVKVQFPESYGAEHLAGKDAVFEVKVKEIRAAEPAAVDDELAKKVGMEDLGKLREAIREEKSRELNQISRMHMKRALLDKLADGHDFEVPPMMVESEFEQIWHQYLHQRDAEEGKHQDHGEHDHAHAHDHEEREGDEETKQEYRDIAVRRVRLGLLLAEIGRVNEIQVGQEDLNRAMIEQARQYPGQEQQVIDYFRNNPEAQQQLSGPIFEDKVVDFIVEMAKVTERAVPLEELLTDPDADTETDEKPKKKAAAKKKAPAKKKAAAKKAESDGDDSDAAKKAPAKKKAAAKKKAESKKAD